VWSVAELADLLPGLVLSSANSINWGRFLPQIVFTFASYTRLVEVAHDPLFHLLTGGDTPESSMRSVTDRHFSSLPPPVCAPPPSSAV
jgi:threonine synthase